MAEGIMVLALCLAVVTVYGALRLLGWVWGRLAGAPATHIAPSVTEMLRGTSPGRGEVWTRPEDYLVGRKI